MKNAVMAVFASFAFHAALAAVLAACISWIAKPAALPALDLSRVELSFAEQEDVAAPAAFPPAQTRSSAAMDSTSPSPPAAPCESPKAELAPMPAPPEVAEGALPEPDLATAATMCMPEPPTAAPRQALVQSIPKPIASIRPDYPARARRRGEQGRVVLEVAVGADGSVAGVGIASSCGFAELDAAAARAAASARFSPATDGGRPVPATVRLPVEFRLRQGVEDLEGGMKK